MEGLKVFYSIMPTKQVWTDKATVDITTKRYGSKTEAIEEAKRLTKQYNTELYIMKAETLIEYMFILSDTLD